MSKVLRAERACFAALALASLIPLALTAQTSSANAAVHPSAQFVQVQPGVRLQVLDYGGSGRPMVFLAALGRDAHDFDTFAPKFTDHHHVYAITRRGFGASDKPAPTDENYDADRLGNDVLAVMTALHIERPILVGHSVGGEELSSVGSRHPDKVSGLIYLEAGYSYAFYNSAEGNALADQTELKRLVIEALQAPPSLELEQKLLASIELNENELKADIAKKIARAQSNPAKNQPAPPGPKPPPPSPAVMAMVTNTRKYTKIPVPILAIFAVPHDLSRVYKDPQVRAAEEAKDAMITGKQADAFEAGLPSAHVIRIAHADHDIFISNETDVIGDMNQFMDHLPKN
jgi:pimeloyl-ACP methyl ester carboxylesterase